MKIRISEATTCFACGIQTPYEVKEIKDVTSLLETKLSYLSRFTKVSSMDGWQKLGNGNRCFIAYATPMINGKYQGCTSVWFEIIDK